MSNVYKPQKSPRNPKCARCRNHGFIVQLKGHSGQCQFLKCNCWKCSLIAERTKIMAFQRRIKKTNKEESALNLTWSRPSDTPVDGTLSGRVENAHLPDTSGVMFPGPGTRTETVIKMPPQRVEEAYGRTYAEMEVPDKSAKDGHDPWITHEPQRKSTPGGGDHGGEDGGYGAPWSGIQDASSAMSRSGPHFPSDYVIAEVGGQRDMYSGEMVAMQFPFKFFSGYPNAYAACPAILVNMPLPPPGPFKVGNGPMCFPHFPAPGPMHYPPEAGPINGGRVPFFAPHPPGSDIRPGSYLEELVLRSHPSPQSSLPKDREHGTSGHPHSNQGSESSSLENASSSQNTV
ncbi:doublesex- and mab-3-related transcription factor 1-like isoform X1 [Oncorhynchus keta]|uniref:doublesex- and mab-3-related transcription factor 1-like isoform X1 n=1 Tax=Oncorhynchus keta TaxID=8018 RepID=UPI0015FC49A4|nr:doublesex- and mab-3-related transcription factor 1-like isoform X1 [Oncorhynchus keta]